MKKYLSVLALDVRSTIYKVFLILIIMALTQVVDYKLVFHNLMEKRPEWSAPVSNVLVSTTSVSNMPTERLPVTWAEVLEQCHTRWIFLAAIVMCSVVFVWSASERGKCKTKFSLCRLRISHKQVFSVFCGYHIVVYLALIAAQILLVLWLHRDYQAQMGLERVPQALFLGFYRDRFLHATLPLSDVWGLLCLVSFVITWGVGTTYIGYKGLLKHRNACGVVIEFTLVQAVLLVCVGSGLLWFAIVGIVVSVVSIVLMLLSVSGKMEVTYEGY